jgi:hypothetical protein
MESDEMFRERRMEQVTRDGPVQELAYAAAYVGQDVLFTYGNDRAYRHAVFAAKVIEKRANGGMAIMVFSPDSASGAYTLLTPYFTTARPGTVEAACSWSWSPNAPPPPDWATRPAPQRVADQELAPGPGPE